MGVAYLDLTSGKVLWVVRPHMLQPSVSSEGKGMGGMGRALCLLCWSQLLGKTRAISTGFCRQLAQDGEKLPAASYQMLFAKIVGGKI